MLERTATSIEPCSSSLQRVLPTSRSCLQTRRKLHTAFWHHGAAEFELIDACQALLRQPPRESTVHAAPAKPTSKRPETMTASSFLLDFLYPTGTAALLRKPYPMYPVRLEAVARPRNHMSRLFTSAVVARRSDKPSSSQATAELDELEGPEKDEYDEEYDDEEGTSRGHGEDGEDPERLALEGPEGLEILLNSDHAGAYDQIFHIWTTLEPDLKEHYMTDVMLAISASTRPIEAWRVIDLFEHYPVEQWTENIVRAAVKAQLTLHNVPEAMSIFRTALTQRGFGRALDYIAAYAFELSSWDLVLRAWELYHSTLGEQELGFEPAASTAAEPVAEPAEAPKTGQATGVAQHGDAESAAVREAERMTEPAASQPGAETERLPDVGPGTEPAASQGAESVSGAMAVQGAETVVDSTITQDVNAVGRPAVDQAAALPVDSQTRQGAGPLAEPSADSAAAPSYESAPNNPLGYATLAATPNFETKVNELYQFLQNDPETLPQRTALVDSFLRHIVRYSLHLFRPSDIVFMLHRAPDPYSYERYIVLSAEQGRRRLASDLYRRYRALPGVRVAASVLKIMLDIFFPHNVPGMEALLEDWYRDHGHLDERAYHKFMAFYGGRGDIKSIMRLAGEYGKHFGRSVEEDSKFITTLMQAHAVRGDPEAAHQVMMEAAERTGEPPEIKRWNILMNAHAKAGDYEGAIDLFSYVCDALEPDDYTFGTIMNMAGFRGDLQFTLELYQLARDRNVKPTVAMVRALVEAYCQNDQYKEAEELCAKVTKRRSLNGDYTLLWNALLHHNAKRRDLTAVNRLLDFMSSQGIAYNQDTYSHLLLALLYARQSHHAMHLLRVAHHEGVFEPTAEHFILLMAAFINTGEPHMVLKTNELMSKLNFPESAMRMTKVIDALGRWQQLPYSKRRGAKAETYLKQILQEFYKSMEREDQGSPDDIRSIIGLYSKVLFILTQMREHATVQQLIRLHNSRYPSRASRETIPLKLLHQMMLADFHEKKFDRVKETWRLILRRATKRYQPAAALLSPDREQDLDDPEQDQDPENDEEPFSKPVIYAQRFRLCDPLKTMQRLYLEEQDPDGLLRLVATVRSRGFDLDSKNWNYHVQALARLKKWREAFTVCERVLMPQWTGWYAVRAQAQMKNQVPLELRRVGTNPARPRPISHTLLVLAKEYMDLEQMMLWSHEAAREFRFVNEECPKTVRAVTTMHRYGSRLEKLILGEEEWDGAGPLEEQDLNGEEEKERKEEGEEEGEAENKDEVVTWRGGRLVRTDEKERFRRPMRYRDVWTQGGFLNSAESVPESGDALSEEDIVSALKAGGEEEGSSGQNGV